jgi:hypothetical protein
LSLWFSVEWKANRQKVDLCRSLAVDGRVHDEASDKKPVEAEIKREQFFLCSGFVFGIHGMEFRGQVI